MIEITSDNFQEEVVGSDVPVLIDFWAPWCGPCKMMTPVLEKIAKKHVGQIKFCKVNVDEVTVSEFPDDFIISSVPALILVEDGRVVKKEIGLKTENAIKALISEAI